MPSLCGVYTKIQTLANSLSWKSSSEPTRGFLYVHLEHKIRHKANTEQPICRGSRGKNIHIVIIIVIIPDPWQMVAYAAAIQEEFSKQYWVTFLSHTQYLRLPKSGPINNNTGKKPQIGMTQESVLLP